jgi:hypothetical protein
MADIGSETRAFIAAALEGDPALESLLVVGINPETLTATIAPGRSPTRIGRVEYRPRVPFLRETIVDLVLRMQRSRWSRLDRYSLTLDMATDEDLDRLAAHGPMRQGASTIVCECGPGWYDMLDGVLAFASETELRAGWKVSQLKEKYGGLRIYHTGAPDDVEEMIDAAEHLSEHVCDVCGAPGKKSNGRGWITTRCEEHEDDRS